MSTKDTYYAALNRENFRPRKISHYTVIVYLLNGIVRLRNQVKASITPISKTKL